MRFRQWDIFLEANTARQTMAVEGRWKMLCAHVVHWSCPQHFVSYLIVISFYIFLTNFMGAGASICWIYHLYKAISLFSSPSVWEEGAPPVWQGVRLSLAVHGHYSRLETADRAKDVRRAHNRNKFWSKPQAKSEKTWTRLRSLRRKFSERNQKNTKPHQTANPKTGFNFWRKPRSK